MAFHAEAERPPRRARGLRPRGRRARRTSAQRAVGRRAARPRPRSAQRGVRRPRGWRPRSRRACASWRCPTRRSPSRSATTPTTTRATTCGSCWRPTRARRCCRSTGGVRRRAGAGDAGPAPRAVGAGERRRPRRRWCSTRSTPASAARRPPPSARALADLGAHHQVLSSPTCPRSRRAATPRSWSPRRSRRRARSPRSTPVDGDERVAEIARMLAGSETTAAHRARPRSARMTMNSPAMPVDPRDRAASARDMVISRRASRPIHRVRALD